MIMINWVERLNYALAYIDNNLCDEIDFNEISRIAACPAETLQRFFVLNTGITLTEYIRRRKLHEAFIELQNTNEKVIDIAIKYGYESPDAFSVAFKRIYGVSPSMARNSDITVEPFLRMKFSLSISQIQEDEIMQDRNTGGNWYEYFYDDTYGWSWSTNYIRKHNGEEGKRLTINVNPDFIDNYLGAVYGGGITVRGDEKAYGIEIYTPLHAKIKTYDTIQIDPSGNITIGGDTVLNVMGALVQAGTAEYMIGKYNIIKDQNGNIVSDEIMRAEIEKYGSWGSEEDWDKFTKEQNLWDSWPWYSTNADDNKILYIKDGTKIICGRRNHNCNINKILSGELTHGEIVLKENGQIILPDGTTIDAPINTKVRVEFETGECTVIMPLERIIDTIVIEDVEFTVIEKAKTFYAGSYFVALDLNSEPDVWASWQWFQDNKDKIIDSVTPDCMLCLSIDYAMKSLPEFEGKERPCAMMHGQETSNLNQPEGVHVIEAEPTLLIKVKATDEAWALTKKLTGFDNPKWHMSPLFGLICKIFIGDEYGYEFNGCKQNGNEETEYYYFNGDKYVTVPVKKK